MSGFAHALDRNRWIVFFALAALVAAGCATKPTVATENAERKIEQTATPIKIDDDTIIVDARPAFEFTTAHIPKSVNMAWTDYTEQEASARGVLQKDLFSLARRLSRAGIAPDTHVVVVGRGLSGGGEEGRIAWMLTYLGVKNVEFTDIDALKARMVNTSDSGPRSAPMWKAQPVNLLLVKRDEVLQAINKRAVDKPVALKPGDDPKLYRIIDTRSEKAYLGNEGLGATMHIPNMDAVNIPWREFFTRDMHPKAEIVDRLKAVGIAQDQRIIVIDEDGVGSAAATMALRSFGYLGAGNAAGGLRDLLNVGGASVPSDAASAQE